jgi:AraC family transcriptional regulator, regulatory protein of adaptative response / DNA-3-methyladenine glycosylase II
VGRFNAVVTTGIYCLPSCAGRPSRSNVLTFELAAAAEAAGYRACLRCRPYRTHPSLSSQTAPQLVCHAVRLVVDGALDEATEDELGSRLGVSGRHIRRLFVEQLGVTPDQLARSTRVHFARRLLDDSDMSITDVTFAAGFGSIRQFNRECRATFHATPSQLRARRRRTDRLVADGGLALRLPFQPPFDWQAMLGLFRVGAINGVEHVTADRYRRTVVIGGDPGVLEIGPGGPDHLVLYAHLPHWKGLIHIVQRARRIFNLDADVDGANRHLGADPMIGSLVRRAPGVRPPGAWDLFETGIEAILTARAEVADTAAIMSKIAERHGTSLPGVRSLGLTHVFPAPEDLVSADLESAGLDRPTAFAVRALAQAAADPPTASDPTRGLDEALAGAVGSMTAESAELFRLRSGQADAFPESLPRLLGWLSQHTGHVVQLGELSSLAEAWRPWRAYAATHLWLTALNPAGHASRPVHAS